jgi:general secretion pathway protein M
MSWFRDYRKVAIIVGLSIAVPVVILLYVLGGLLVLRADYQTEIDRVEPRISRLSGLVQSEARLNESSSQVGGRIAELVYPASSDPASVAADLQKNIRELIAATGLTVSNSRIMPASQTESFDSVGLSLTVNGDLAALDEALGEIAAYSPVLMVESLDVRPNRAARRSTPEDQQTVTASLQLSSLRSLR